MQTRNLKRPLPNINEEKYEFDLSYVPLKEDHEQCPLWVGDLRRKFYKKKNQSGYYEKREDVSEEVIDLVLEAFSPNYKKVYDFLITIAEPKSRQEFIHNYEINPASLNAAITLGISTSEIIQKLEEYSKTQRIPMEIEKYICRTSSSFGKAKLVLKDNRYFIEAETMKVIDYYKAIEVLSDCWMTGEAFRCYDDDTEDAGPKPRTDSSTRGATAMEEEELEEAQVDDDDEEEQVFGEVSDRQLNELLMTAEEGELERKLDKFYKDIDQCDEPVIRNLIYRLEIDPKKIDKLKKERTLMSTEEKFKYMLTQEYDYKKINKENPNLVISMKTTVKVRPYQEKALSRMFVGGRARSGVIVLPCGAGKTLVGISAINRVKKRTLVLCINNITVKQWRSQILLFSNLDPSNIKMFISETKDQKIPDLNLPCIVISTYNMISRNDEGRSTYSREFVRRLGEVEWGLLILDEVQVAPAEVFKRAFLTKTKSHCKLGLTATLVREDNKIEDLQFYIGPKLYEESWIDLTDQGYLARVQCVEIRIPMTPEFMTQYKRKNDLGKNKKIYLYTGNPNKFYVLQYLIKVHLSRGDKILVFIDSIDILIEYARLLKKPYICGELKNAEREKILQFFQELNDWNVLFVSRVGDVGIDLPDANVAIEVSSLFSSRRQEAQRLGRILRPKESKDKYQSYFYSLVSTGTDEMRYAVKRQKFLVKQGYTFKILQEEILPYNQNEAIKKKMKMSSKEDQKLFLEKLLTLSVTKEKKDPKKTQKPRVTEIRRRSAFGGFEGIAGVGGGATNKRRNGGGGGFYLENNQFRGRGILVVVFFEELGLSR